MPFSTPLRDKDRNENEIGQSYVRLLPYTYEPLNLFLWAFCYFLNPNVYGRLVEISWSVGRDFLRHQSKPPKTSPHQQRLLPNHKWLVVTPKSSYVVVSSHLVLINFLPKCRVSALLLNGLGLDIQAKDEACLLHWAAHDFRCCGPYWLRLASDR